MERLLIFPLNGDTEVLVNNLKSSNDYQILAISSFYEDEDRLAYLCKNTGIYCSTDFIHCLGMVDAVVFAENTMNYSYEGYKERVYHAIKNQKKIYASELLLKKLEIDDKTTSINCLQKNELVNMKDDRTDQEIDIPIVAVMGMGENCDKFNLQVKIRKIIVEQGYNVLAICSNVLGKFLDMELLPGFIFSEKLSYPEKIKAFKCWIYDLQDEKKPNIIVVGCPGGISKFEAFETNYYAEIPSVISNALDIDTGMIMLYANMEQNKETTKLLDDYILAKYNIEANSYCISTQFFKTDYEWKKIRYYKILKRDEEYSKNKEGCGCRISYIENDNEIENQVESMLTGFRSNFHAL